eukprot:9496477-Pyramimonas_sp.AAC.1
MGARFDRWLATATQKEQDDYGLMGRTQKAEFRKSWGEKQFKVYDSRRFVESEMVETDAKIGTMLNYDAILKLEGGRESPAA